MRCRKALGHQEGRVQVGAVQEAHGVCLQLGQLPAGATSAATACACPCPCGTRPGAAARGGLWVVVVVVALGQGGGGGRGGCRCGPCHSVSRLPVSICLGAGCCGLGRCVLLLVVKCARLLLELLLLHSLLSCGLPMPRSHGRPCLPLLLALAPALLVLSRLLLHGSLAARCCTCLPCPFYPFCICSSSCCFASSPPATLVPARRGLQGAAAGSRNEHTSYPWKSHDPEHWPSQRTPGSTWHQGKPHATLDQAKHQHAARQGSPNSPSWQPLPPPWAAPLEPLPLCLHPQMPLPQQAWATAAHLSAPSACPFVAPDQPLVAAAGLEMGMGRWPSGQQAAQLGLRLRKLPRLPPSPLVL